MGKQATKLLDIFSGRNYVRYWKKGIALGLLYGLVAIAVNTLIEAIVKALGIDVSQGLMTAIEIGGVKVAITAFIGVMIQWTIGGFLIEYIQNAKNTIMKWVQR